MHCETCHRDIGGKCDDRGRSFNKKLAKAFREAHLEDHPGHQVKIFKEGLPRLGRW